MKHGSLFSGIGGFDLAAQWMGWENVFHCEWNEFGKRVLNYYWPNAISYHDITETDFTIHRGGIDILTGGFPCQPYSSAGKRLGKEDSRHLWPEMLRAIREIRPTWVVGENVYGLVNWNGGLVFDEVQADLEKEGYTVQPVIIPACAVNAPHRRDRIWFIAHSEGYGSNRTPKPAGSPAKRQNGCKVKQPAKRGKVWPTAHPDRDGHELRGLGEDRPTQGESKGNEQQRKRIRENDRGISQQAAFADPQQPGREGADIFTGSARFEPGTWDNWPTVEPTIRRGDDGLSDRLDGITFPKWRNESIKAYGNAVVPQVVYQIFKAIEQYETDTLPT